MKKLSDLLLRNYNKVILFVMAIVGFTGCEDNNSLRAEYGTPYADFIVKGKVLSKATNQSVSNIRVVLRDTANLPYILSDTVYSNTEGKYELKITDFPLDKTFKLLFSDEDGSTNGSFSLKDTLIEFKNPQFTNGDGHWYNGKTAKEIDMKLLPD